MYQKPSPLRGSNLSPTKRAIWTAMVAPEHPSFHGGYHTWQAALNKNFYLVIRMRRNCPDKDLLALARKMIANLREALTWSDQSVLKWIEAHEDCKDMHGTVADVRAVWQQQIIWLEVVLITA